MGRFISRDPKEELAGLNLYAFVHNNPINKWDYLGMEDCDGQDDVASYGDEFSIDPDINIDDYTGFVSRDDYGGNIPYYASVGDAQNLDPDSPLQNVTYIAGSDDDDVLGIRGLLANNSETANGSGVPISATTGGGGIDGYTATDLANNAVGLAGSVMTNSATTLQEAGQFAMNGNVYKQGFYGNQYVSSSSVKAAKASQANVARIGQNIGRCTAIVGSALAVREVYTGGASDRSLARGSVAGAMTTIALLGGPWGAGVAFVYGVTDALGAWNWFYDGLSDSRRFGGPQ